MVKKAKNYRKMEKIRRLLGNNYHLCISFNPDGENIEWVLYKRYDSLKFYYCKENKAIMSGGKDDIDELYKFAKKHHKINRSSATNALSTILCDLGLIILIINTWFFKSNATCRGFVLGLDFAVIIFVVVDFIIENRNSNIDLLESEEELQKLLSEEKNKYGIL